MSHKDIEIKITFEDDGRPKVSISFIFKNSEEMGIYLQKMKVLVETIFSTENENATN